MQIQEQITILKEMWRIQEKLDTGRGVSDGELKYYNNHLSNIQMYYLGASEYWKLKSPIW